MKQLKLEVRLRKRTGSGPVGRLRKEGRVPAVIYGPQGNKNISMTEPALRELMRAASGSATLINLADEEGGETICILKDTQRNSVTDKFEHLDFLEVSQDKEMNTEIPVHPKGEAIGVKNENGVLEIVSYTVEIRCLPKDMPEYIEVDVSGLHTGDSITISKLPALPGVTYTQDDDFAVIVCSGEDSTKPEEEPADEADGAAEAEEPAEAAAN